MKLLRAVALVALVLSLSLSVVPAFAAGLTTCVADAGMTCTPPPVAYGSPSADQPNARPVTFWPDTRPDVLSPTCELVFDGSGVSLGGLCNASSDFQAQADCTAYVSYWLRTANDSGPPLWWPSEAAVRCSWSDGSNEATMLTAAHA